MGVVVFGAICLGIIAVGEEMGLWQMAITWEPYFLTLLVTDFALCAFIYLLTWRIARRFGWRGLSVVVFVVAVIGPARDYWYMANSPKWGAYRPGFAPVLAVSATYVLMVLPGHGLMHIVAGPARGPSVARWPWETAGHRLSLTRRAKFHSGTSKRPRCMACQLSWSFLFEDGVHPIAHRGVIGGINRPFFLAHLWRSKTR